jgi:hypothetical protein
MTTQTSQIALAATTPQQYHDFIVAFQSGLAAVGLTPTADTGQVDLSAGTVPFPANYSSGSGGLYCQNRDYQIYKMSAAGLPDIYLRFDFGILENYYSAADSLNFPYVQMRAALASDGAGNLSMWVQPQPAGTVVPLNNFQSRSSIESFSGSDAPGTQRPSSNPQACDFASDGQNYLTIMLGEQAPTYEASSLYVVGIERTIDPTSGNYDDAGFVGFCGTGIATTWSYVDIANQKEHNGTTSMPSITPPFHIGTNDSTTVYTFPFIGSTIVPKGAPTVGVAYYNLNVTTTLTFQETLYSVPHTYKCCPRSNVGADPYNTGSRIALRFD